MFGANWRTTLYGALRSIFAGIVTGTLTFPSDWHDPKQVALFVCVVIATGFGIKFAQVAKDKDVTGGTTQQTASGDVAHFTSASQSVRDTKLAATN